MDFFVFTKQKSVILITLFCRAEAARRDAGPCRYQYPFLHTPQAYIIPVGDIIPKGYHPLRQERISLKKRFCLLIKAFFV